MVRVSLWASLVTCMSLLCVSHAEPSATPTSSSSTASTCATALPISLRNGGFDDGEFAPWSRLSNSNPTTKQRIVSPGYNKSKHALEMHFVPANITEYSIAQTTRGKQCPGYYYNISFAWNWLHYTGPEGPGASSCWISATTGYCSSTKRHYATRTPGWHHTTDVCEMIYLCHPNASDYVVDVTCVGANGTVLPAFTMLIDDFQISNADRTPGPEPTGTCH